MIGLELADGRGRSWTLTGHGVVPAVTDKGVRGLGRPTIDSIRQAGAPGVHGHRWRGWRASERQVVLPLAFWGDPAGLVAQVRDFAAGIVPEQPGYPGNTGCTLTAILPDSTRWTLGMQLVDDGGLTLEREPHAAGGMHFETVWDADVFWSGPAWTSLWQTEASSTPWLMPSGGVAYLIPSNTFATAQTVNDGDVRAWPVWTITGPSTLASVGVGNHMVTLALTLAAGETVTIDTNPEQGQMALRGDGGDVTDMLTDVDWAPVEPGLNELEISLTGTGTVAMSYRPQRLAIL